MFTVYITLAFFFWWFYYKFNKDIFQPCGVFLFVWFFTSAISNLDLSTFIPPWSIETHIVVLLSGLSFFFGSLFFLTKHTFSKIEKKPCSYTYIIFSRTLFYFSLLCFLIEWKVNDFKIVLLSGSDYDLKSNILSIPFVHYGTILLPFLAIYKYFEIINSGKKKIGSIVILSFIVIFYSLFCSVSRGDMLLYLFSFLFIYTRYYKLKLKSVFFLISIFLLIVVGIMLLRISSEATVFVMTDNPYVSVFYSYIATCYSNLDQLIKLDLPYNLFGNGTLKFLWTLLGQKDILPVNSIEEGGFNATTYLYAFYHDYKIIGIIIFPFLMGSFYSLIYKITSLNNSYWILMLAVLQKSIFFAFFGNYLFGELTCLFPFILTAIFILFVSKYNLKINIISQMR